MSVEKTIIYENERWRVTQYFDGAGKLEKVAFCPKLDILLDYEEISTLQKIFKGESL